MSTVNEKMTALANEVRELSGTNESLGIVAMTNVLSTENDHFDNNITTQEGLITQISTLVATKANPPSGPVCETFSITVGSTTPLYYFDNSCSLRAASNETIQALHGIIMYSGMYIPDISGASYEIMDSDTSMAFHVVKFYGDGGHISISAMGDSSN